MKAALLILASLLLVLKLQSTPPLPPMPPMPGGMKASISMVKTVVELPLVPPSPPGVAYSNLESLLPRAYWVDGIAGLGSNYVVHSLSHDTNDRTISISFTSQAGAVYWVDWCPSNSIWYPAFAIGGTSNFTEWKGDWIASGRPTGAPVDYFRIRKQ